MFGILSLLQITSKVSCDSQHEHQPGIWFLLALCNFLSATYTVLHVGLQG